MLGIVPLVEFGLVLGGHIHGVEQETLGGFRRDLVAGQDLLTFEAHQPLVAAAEPLRPRRQIDPADRQIAGLLQDVDIFEIVGRHRNLAITDPDPALAAQEAGAGNALRHVLGVVPVVKLVLGGVRHIHRRDEDA